MESIFSSFPTLEIVCIAPFHFSNSRYSHLVSERLAFNTRIRRVVVFSIVWKSSVHCAAFWYIERVLCVTFYTSWVCRAVWWYHPSIYSSIHPSNAKAKKIETQQQQQQQQQLTKHTSFDTVVVFLLKIWIVLVLVVVLLLLLLPPLRLSHCSLLLLVVLQL